MTGSKQFEHDAGAAANLSQVAQRILKLAEICVLEHLEALERSQAVGLSEMAGGLDFENERRV